MTTVPEPHFIDRDPAQILSEAIESWEDKSGVALAPAQPEMLLLKVFAYRETLVRQAIQDAAKRLLLRWSTFPVIDALGELIDAPRLEASAAVTTLRFTLEEEHGTNVLIPEGTRARTKDGAWTFETDEDATIEAGELSVDVKATATQAGAGANGYIAGQVATLVDTIDPPAAVTSLTETSGGAAKEDDARYSERLLLAPDGSSTAGAEESYRFHALSVSTAVADVAVLSPTPGDIVVAVLATDGLPSQDVLDLVEAGLSGEKKRPLTDTVTVQAATEVQWTLEARLTLYKDADSAATLAAAETAAEKYRQERSQKLGKDLVPSQAIKVLKVSGVYDVALDSPAGLVVIEEDEWANCTSVSVTVDGFVEETEGD
ncbi:MAG: baseplate assembly protein [Persicimonas sp.]